MTRPVLVLRLSALAACAATIAAATIAVGGGGTTSIAAPGSDDITAPAAANRQAVRVDPPANNPRRPNVYLAFYGNEGLLGNTDNQWSYVRDNLDGLWGNPFDIGAGVSTSIDRTIALTRKVDTRKLIVEHPIVENGRCIGFRNDRYFTDVEQRSGNIRFEREAAAIYAPIPNCWSAVGGINAARNEYRRQGYGKVYTLFQPQNLSNQVNAAAYPTITPGSAGDVAYRTGDGVVIECPIDACLNPTFGAPFVQAINDARARNVPFIWFTGYSRGYGIGTTGWLARVQNTYNAMASFGLWRADDAIVIINYDGYRALPERNANGTPADTVTGILAWLLEQRPIGAPR